MNTIDCQTEKPGEYPHLLRVRTHSFHADLLPDDGGQDTAPNPHDYFDAALAACKATTALWYAKRKSIPLERVETQVERDNSQERSGVYKLRVRFTFHGPLSDDQRALLARAIGACPIQKLMTTTDVQIETLT